MKNRNNQNSLFVIRKLNGGFRSRIVQLIIKIYMKIIMVG